MVAARTLADVGDIARFADRNRFAPWTGTAPLDTSTVLGGIESWLLARARRRLGVATSSWLRRGRWSETR